jgi:hypothetical protein
VDSVKAAIEDEKAAATLAKTLQQTVGATKEQQKAAEDYISATQLQSGVLDDELRPSLARLVRSTGDVGKAQKLQQLALNISAASGKDLATVTNALAKANDGQLTGLKKLGITLGSQAKNAAVVTKAQESYNKAVERAKTVGDVWGTGSKQYQSSMMAVKAKQEELNTATAKGVDWVGELAKQYDGSLDASLDTTAGKLKLLNAKWDDAKEKMGYALMDGLQPLVDWATGPEGQKFIDDFMKEFSSAAIAVAKALPEILSSLKKVGGVASGLGLNFDTFLNPKFIAAAAAFRLTPGPVQVKAIAAVAAYAAADFGAYANDKKTQEKRNKAEGWVSGVDLSGAKGKKQIADAQQKYADLLQGKTDSKAPKGYMDWSQYLPTPSGGGPKQRRRSLGVSSITLDSAPVIPLSQGAGNGMTVNVNVAGSVIRERDLAVSVRDQIAQMIRRRGLDPAILGV